MLRTVEIWQDAQTDCLMTRLSFRSKCSWIESLDSIVAEQQNKIFAWHKFFVDRGAKRHVCNRVRNFMRSELNRNGVVQRLNSGYGLLGLDGHVQVPGGLCPLLNGHVVKLTNVIESLCHLRSTSFYRN